MAATLTQERFTASDWLFERKFDGIRLLAFKRGDDVRLYSRNHLEQHLPAVAAAVASLPVRDAIVQLMPSLHERRKVGSRGARQPRNQVFDVDLAAVDRLAAEQIGIFLENIRADRCGRGLRHVTLLGLG